jgi:hypothetical protein
VSELDYFLLLAKIKGEVALALLAAPSYVHVSSPLQVRWLIPKFLSRNERGRFGALKSDSTHHFFSHFFRNGCTKSGSLRFHSFPVVH